VEASVFPPVYAILDKDLLQGPVEEYAEALASAGIELLQYRAKRQTTKDYFEASASLQKRLVGRNVRLIVNDRPDVAAMAGAGGVHVGQEDLPPDDARRVCGSQLWVGVSTHNLDQLRAAEFTSADYIAFGPIFATSTKENPDPIVGLELLRRARELTQKPIVAIGGITLECAAEVYAAGADSVAVIRDLAAAPDPAARAREFLAAAKRERK
jgi:thiamine-phosphate pyrophosphorylase